MSKGKWTHSSKSSFFVQKFNFDFPEKIVDFFGWKCCGFGLFSCWQLWFHKKNCQKNFGEKLVKMLGFCQNWIFGQNFDFYNSVIWKESTSEPAVKRWFCLLGTLDFCFICSTSSLVCLMKAFLAAKSLVSMRNFAGFFSTIWTVSSRSSKSHSIDLSEFRSSVAAHSCSSADLISTPSSPSRHRSYRSRVLRRAFRTSLLEKIRGTILKLQEARTWRALHTYSLTTKNGSSIFQENPMKTQRNILTKTSFCTKFLSHCQLRLCKTFHWKRKDQWLLSSVPNSPKKLLFEGIFRICNCSAGTFSGVIITYKTKKSSNASTKSLN